MSVGERPLGDSQVGRDRRIAPFGGASRLVVLGLDALKHDFGKEKVKKR